ncbi:MAG TPA: hypothetical protein VFA97_05125 [Gaiellaceae bacterium]|nr:hypothetical protein [Gaiellaceae bacterium]
MAAIKDMALWRQLRSPGSALLLLTTALCLIRANSQPGLDVRLGGTTATVVPGDVALLALFILCVASVARHGLVRSSRAAACAATAFCALVVITGATNGSAPLVASVKVVELAVLALGALVLVRTREQLEAMVDVLVLFTIAADALGLVKFVQAGGGRQSSFLGEHDFAALATLPLLYGLILVFEGRRTMRAAVCIVAGSIGCILGAALASLLGLYLGALAIAFAIVRRGDLRYRPAAVTLATLAVVTAGTLTLRSGDFGFLQAWFGKPEQRPGQYAASWSQRLIFTYIDGRVFLGHPLLGTGWYPLLPPHEFARYLPAAKRRFSDQPTRYFPSSAKPLIPQQTFDQVPAELGLVGSVVFLVLLAGVARAAVRAARGSPLAVAWFVSILGAIAGEALFGGTPLTAEFWLVIGLALALGRGLDLVR